MSIANYLTALDEQRDALARNLVTMGVQADTSEKLNTLVPKVLQILQTRQETTLFKADIDALHDYGETIYTFYNDGYRSLAGFSESYPNFCCEENGYAIYYNQQDFNWGATIYTQCVTPVHITRSHSILFSYMSGFFDFGEMWLVPQSNTAMSAADTARYIHEQIMQGHGIHVPFNWLQTTDSYTNILLTCDTIPDGEYYLAWKAVTDNTHPFIRLIKVMEV